MRGWFTVPAGVVACLLVAAPAAADVPAPSYVDHVEWAHRDGRASLRVYPTPFSRAAAGAAGSSGQGDDAWREVLARTPDADTAGMREQFLCHWRFAELVQPGKVSWNLEPWRPVVDSARMFDAGCNPGGPEEIP
jgi:hypothetical protein